MRRRFVASALMGALAFVATTGVAEARTLVVHPGQSIQRAVDRAHRGDTVRLAPGTYHQNVTIQKRISLVGAGWGPHGSRLFPAANPVSSVCSSPGSVHGICVAGRFDHTARGEREPEGEGADLGRPLVGHQRQSLAGTCRRASVRRWPTGHR